jgi:hypothetical protein
MKDATTYTERTQVWSGTPDGYKMAALQDSRRKMGMRLYDILSGHKIPCVVDISETITQDRFIGNTEVDTIQIDVRVTPVEHRRVIMADYRYSPTPSVCTWYHWPLLYLKLKAKKVAGLIFLIAMSATILFSYWTVLFNYGR